MEVMIKGKTSLNNLVGIWSKIQVDGLEETIAVSSESLTGPKWSEYKSGSKDKVLLKLLYLMIHQR